MAIRQRRPVGPQADPAAGRIGVVVADLFVGRVMIDQRIHVAGADGEEQPRPAELPPRLDDSPVRLAQHGDAKSGRFQHAAQDRHGEARVIDVGVAGDENDIDGIPAALAHLGRRHRQRRGGKPLLPERQRQARRWTDAKTIR